MSRVISIEGLSGVGTTTSGMVLAQKLNYSFISFGMMYRLLAHGCIKWDVDLVNWMGILSLMDRLDFELVSGESASMVFAGEMVFECDLQLSTVSEIASQLSSINAVRERMSVIQQNIINQGNFLVIEGRALSRLFSGLNYKFFLFASLKVRSQRRFKQLRKRDQNIQYETVYDDIMRRDERDRKSGLASDLNDLIEIDTSKLKVEEVVVEMFQHIKS